MKTGPSALHLGLPAAHDTPSANTACQPGLALEPEQREDWERLTAAGQRARGKSTGQRGRRVRTSTAVKSVDSCPMLWVQVLTLGRQVTECPCRLSSGEAAATPARRCCESAEHRASRGHKGLLSYRRPPPAPQVTPGAPAGSRVTETRRGAPHGLPAECRGFFTCSPPRRAIPEPHLEASWWVLIL